MFQHGFEKVGMLSGAALGAVAGGEDDKKSGGKKNRWIGAVRGAGTEAATGFGAAAGVSLANRLLAKNPSGNIDLHRARIAKAIVGGALGALAGGTAGYKLLKKYGPQYDKEKSKK